MDKADSSRADTKAYPRVAVLTPVYNGGAFLREAMASVQAQDYPNLIHFILNNASTDNTLEIVKEFQNAKVPVIVSSNGDLLPQVENWNKCVALGSKTTDYFRILCADDTIPDHAMAKMVALAESDAGIAVVAGLRGTSGGVEEFGWNKRDDILDGKEAIRSCFLKGYGLAPSHVLYRTSALCLRPTFFDGGILSFDTEVVFFLLSQGGAKLGFLHEPVGFTGRHAGSMTETAVNQRHSDYFDWLFLIRRYGSVALSAEELVRYEKAFRRHYLCRLMAWRLHGNKDAFRWHLAELEAFQSKPGTVEYIDALADYALRKVGLRSRWNQYPQG